MKTSKTILSSRVPICGIAMAIYAIIGFRPAMAFDQNTRAQAYQNWINNFYFTDSYGGAFIKLQGDSTRTWGFWQAAEEIEVVEDAVAAGVDTPDRVTALCNHFVHDFGTDWSGYWNDDIGWAAMAFDRAYVMTGNETYQTYAQNAVDLAWGRGWDPVIGGMWQRPPTNGVNSSSNNSQCTCGNNPIGEASFMLYQTLGDTKYLVRAQAEYNWIKANCFNPATGEVVASPGVTEQESYDQGGFATLCWDMGDIADAMKCGDYMKNTYGTSLEGYGAGGDSGGFNGICLRGLARAGYDIGYLQSVCDQAWGCKNADNLTGQTFSGRTTDIPRYTWDCSNMIAGMMDVPVVSTFPPGPYQLQCEASGYLVSVAGGSQSAGAAVRQYSTDGIQDQMWLLIPTSGGYYQIQNVNSGFDLAVTNNSTTAGAAIVQEPFGSQGNDQWLPVVNSDGSYTFRNLHSNLPLNDPAASTVQGTQFTQSASNGTAAQKFNVTPVIPFNTFYLECKHSSLFVEVTGGSSSGGAAVVQNAKDGTSAELWTFIPTSNGNYQLYNTNSGLDLAVANPSTAQGALIVQEPFGTQGNDQWTLVVGANSTYCLQNVLSGMLLEDAQASTTAGTQLDQAPSSGATSQEFNLIPHTGPIVGARYHLRCELSNLDVNVAGSSSTAGAAVQQYSYSNVASQSWIFIPTTSGYYQIQNVNSGLDLAVTGASTTAGAQIVQEPYGTQGNDQWFLANNKDGSYSVFNLHSGLALNDANGGTAVGNPFQQATATGGTSQSFYLTPDGVTPPATMIPSAQCHLTCKASNMLLEVAGASTSAGSVVQQAPDNGTATQAWTFIPNSAGYYQIRDVNSGFDLAVTGASTSSGAKIVQEPFGTQGNDQWSVISNTDGSYSFLNLNSGLFLDDTNGSTTAGNQFQQATSNGTVTQEFVLSPYTPLSSSKYLLQCAASNMFVGIAGGSTSNGASVQQNSRDGISDQGWVLIPTGSGYFQIQNIGSGLDLAVVGASTTSGAQIVQEPFGTSGDDQWSLVSNTDGSYSFLNLNSGLFLNDPNGSTAAGASLQQATSSGTVSQEFFLLPYSTPIASAHYQLRCEASNMIVGVASGSTSAGAAVQQKPSAEAAVTPTNQVSQDSQACQAQEWSFIPTSGGYYQIQNLNSGFDLAVIGASTTAGAQIVQEPFGTQGNDQWSMVVNTDGSCTFRNLNSGLQFNDPGASTASGTQFTQSAPNSTPAQKFYILLQ